uniref:Uncharacterized protein n=1 Tax=Spongospora subterranea TaxID=70186 RepID=A0A0H5QVV5_9EUKA|eukprot:CRZ06055.1 hypothetical protein [Spongospora subterranea]
MSKPLLGASTYRSMEFLGERNARLLKPRISINTSEGPVIMRRTWIYISDLPSFLIGDPLLCKFGVDVRAQPTQLAKKQAVFIDESVPGSAYAVFILTTACQIRWRPRSMMLMLTFL